MADVPKLVWRNWPATWGDVVLGVLALVLGRYGTYTHGRGGHGGLGIPIGWEGDGVEGGAGSPLVFVSLWAIMFWAAALLFFWSAFRAKVTIVEDTLTARMRPLFRRSVHADEISCVTLGVFGGFFPHWKDRGKGSMVRPVIVLKDQGQRIGLYPLGSYSVLESGAPGPKEEPRARQIADILGVPYVDPADIGADYRSGEAQASMTITGPTPRAGH
ncbi:MAG: hypothetical protein FWD59_09215 [Micrococcales bacterium]|nr:hypothetical protein [Micrococcales bacterium]